MVRDEGCVLAEGGSQSFQSLGEEPLPGRKEQKSNRAKFCKETFS